METTIGGTLIIDGVALHALDLEHVAPEKVTLDCQVPDDDWKDTDTAGHTHRWWRSPKVEDPQLPTLTETVEHRDCDGGCGDEGCEGYTISVWRCIACDEQVKPGFRLGTTTVETTSAHWEIETVEDGCTGPVQVDRTRRAATVSWPSGPGQMATMTGEAVEVNRVVERHVANPVRMLRTFHFMEAT
jgi:hypothetical protein